MIHHVLRRLALGLVTLLLISFLVYGLIRSIPRIDTAAVQKSRLEAIGGVVPSLISPPPGCRFAAR